MCPQCAGVVVYGRNMRSSLLAFHRPLYEKLNQHAAPAGLLMNFLCLISNMSNIIYKYTCLERA